MPEDVLDILLVLSNLQGFVAGTREAAASVRGIGTAAAEGSAEANAAGSKLAGVAGLARKAFIGTSVAIAGFGYESVKAAITFDRQMELIHTQAGAVQGEVTRMSNSVLAMASSGQYMQGPNALAEGLFHLESIGLRGARALDALKIASQGAAVGNANLEETATALGAAWLVNIKGAGDLNHVMATINATVGAGNMRMGDLITSLGTGVLAAGKLAHLSLQDVLGALAVLSDEGYQGSSAMAQLATSFHFLTDPSHAAQKALAQIGLSVYSLSNTMRTQGLPAALAQLRAHLTQFGGSPARQEQLLGSILPAGRGRVLEVLMNQVDRYNMKIHQIQTTTGNFSKDIVATHKTAAFQIHAAWSQIQADMIHLGHMLEPIAVAAAKALASFVTWFLRAAPAIAHILPYLIPLVAGFVAYKAAVIGAVIAERLFAAAELIATIASMIPMITSLRDVWILLDLAMEANPIFIVIGVVVALVAAIVFLFVKVKAVREAFVDAWHAITSAVKTAIGAIVAAFHWFVGIATTVIDFVVKHWRLFILILGPVGLAIDFVTKHFDFFKSSVTTAWHAVASAANWAWNTIIHPVLNAIVSTITWLYNTVNNTFHLLAKAIAWPFQWAWNNIIKPVANWIVGAFRWVVGQIGHLMGKIFSPLKAVGHFFGGIVHGAGSVISSVGNFLGLQSGGAVTQGGSVWVGERGPELLTLPAGAQVRPLNTLGASAAGALNGNFTFVVPVQIDGREVARAVGKFVDNRLARQ